MHQTLTGRENSVVHGGAYNFATTIKKIINNASISRSAILMNNIS
jgi:hypothetical protein